MQVISTARTCNLILIVLDCLKPISHKKLIEHELEGFGIRLNKEPPGITFRKKDKGGISLTTTISNPKLDLDGERLQASGRQKEIQCVGHPVAVGWSPDGSGWRAKAGVGRPPPSPTPSST